MELIHFHLITVAVLIFHFQHINSSCPQIYEMIDKHHSYCATKESVQSLPPTIKDIEIILEVHNQERVNVNAKNMQKMYWNTDLAEIAQRYADHCDFKHDKSHQRQAPRIPLSTGQNLAMGYNTWYLALRGWADEKQNFVYGNNIQKGVVGHYTQMVKDTSALIGCGLAICPTNNVDPNRDWPHYVCNYVTGQLGDNKPYTRSNPSQSNNNQLYDCHGLVCLYNGTLNLDLCQCQCQSYASGKQCENLDCSLLTDTCNYGNDKSICIKYSNVPSECPKFCGLCDRYDEMKKYYNSIDIPTNIGDQTIYYAQNVSSKGNMFISLIFIQLIIVLFVLL